MSASWWSLYLEHRCGKSNCYIIGRTPFAQRETLEELLDIIALLDEAEETCDIFAFVQGDSENRERELRYDEVVAMLADEAEAENG